MFLQKRGLIWTGFVLTIISLVVMTIVAIGAFIIIIACIDRCNGYFTLGFIMWGLVAVAEC